MKLTQSQSEFLSALAQKIPSQQIYTDPADACLYSYDNGRHRGLPFAVIFPQTTEEVQEIVRACAHFQVPISARGRGTGTPGGSVSYDHGIVVSFEKMDKILEINLADRIIKVQAGCLNQTLQKSVEPKGFFWVPDPSSSAFCTVGGNLAYNAGGPRAVKYGATREHVLGLTAVTGLGEIIYTGNRTTKGAVGYDLTRLLVGSEGTLALMTEMVLKLTPMPTYKSTYQVRYQDVASAVDAVVRVMSQSALPCALEFLDPQCTKLIGLSSSPTDENCLLLIDIDDENAKSSLLESLQGPGLINCHFAEQKEDVEKCWAARKQLSQALRKLSPKKISEDVVVPVSKVSALVLVLKKLSIKYDLPIVSFGHIGNGNLHVNLLIQNADHQKKSDDVLSELFDAVINLEGTLSGEHGIGLEKKPYVSKAIDVATLDMMKKIKEIFDPNNILNPGKIF